MDYYLVFENGDEKYNILLGTQSFGFFYPEPGLDFLTDMAAKNPELIKFIKIITERGLQYTVEDFLNLFEGEEHLEVRRRT